METETDTLSKKTIKKPTKKKATKKKTTKKKAVKKKVGTTRKRQSKNSEYYVSPAKLLEAVIESRKQDKMTDELAAMLVKLTARYAMTPRFIGYTYNDDMQAYANIRLLQTWKAFDPSRSEKPNPFAYYTQCIKNSFKQYLKKEKIQRTVRDKLLVSKGLTPSFNYQMEYADSHTNETQFDHCNDFESFYPDNDEYET